MIEVEVLEVDLVGACQCHRLLKGVEDLGAMKGEGQDQGIGIDPEPGGTNLHPCEPDISTAGTIYNFLFIKGFNNNSYC